jgi:hypothetical protein
MMKIAINRCHGGFGLSDAAYRRYAELKGLQLWVEKDEEFSILTHYWTVPPEKRPPDLSSQWQSLPLDVRAENNKQHSNCRLYDKDIPRDDPDLIQTIKELKKEANGPFASLKIVNVPDDVEWQIEEYDGLEWIAEKHRTWE